MAGFVTQACFNVIQALSAILQLARASEGNAIHHFIPLVLKGGIKKIIVISSPHADLSLIKDIVMENNALYVAFKAASNVIIAKFSSQYKRDGALTFSSRDPTLQYMVRHNQIEGVEGLIERLLECAPRFRGTTPMG
ncbi:hypothetical protein BM1_10121 [Bipolaris maydis]|nr:hypothetical protein BM1_10121 [Bipolaris maydis]KAJ5021776.1 hypothetical protein J3E73DRAFT_374766 [Bipolaris maydis]